MRVWIALTSLFSFSNSELNVLTPLKDVIERWPSVQVTVTCPECTDSHLIKVTVDGLTFGEFPFQSSFLLSNISSSGLHVLELSVEDLMLSCSTNFIRGPAFTPDSVFPIRIISPVDMSRAVILDTVNSAIKITVDPDTLPLSRRLRVTLHLMDYLQSTFVLMAAPLSGVFDLDGSFIKVDSSFIKKTTFVEIVLLPLDGNSHAFPVMNQSRISTRVMVQLQVEQSPMCQGLECLVMGNSNAIAVEQLAPIPATHRVDRMKKKTGILKAVIKCRVVTDSQEKKIVVMDAANTLSDLFLKTDPDQIVEAYVLTDQDGFQYSIDEKLQDVCDSKTSIHIKKLD